ncbi:RNA exonuclease 3 [Ptychographa xylographoides]|nr:RNA exonuclease 3 [Ptychographa xylographoides]
MFSTVGLFKSIPCPEVNRCQLPNCFFLHHQVTGQEEIRNTQTCNIEQQSRDIECLPEDSRPRKKRRIADEGENEPAMLHLAEPSSTKSIRRLEDPLPGSTKRSKPEAANVEQKSMLTVKDVSPPPLRRTIKTGASDKAIPKPSEVGGDETTSIRKDLSREAGPKESLNPRMLRKPPASHTVRLKLLLLLHEQIARLNKEVRESNDPSKSALELSSQELVTEALDQEYQAAKDDPIVYANMLKLRIIKLKKMKLAEWKKERLKQIAKQFPELVVSTHVKTPVTLTTGLSSKEELSLLPKLITPQACLSQYGYVTTQLSEIEVEQARAGVEASQGWEQCDRCKSRFQVFPGRRAEDGALTTGGKCSYHYGKPRRPVKEKADTGYHDTIYTCCNQAIGSPGCTIATSHVFKVSEAKRLALVMPFEKTPIKGPTILESAVCFDCEMGYTVFGMELIRLTATSWPDGKELLDVLVRPIGEILDLNSRFSGVWPENYSNAGPYSPAVFEHQETQETHNSERPMCMVNSPSEARELLFAHLTTTTPLIGHALENDLNSVRIIHPTIIDTVLLYPHPRGLPIRHGLKMLVKKHLNRDIQTGGAQGHDSGEDARAAGELVRFKVMETWKAMQADGWRVKAGEFFAPLPEEAPLSPRRAVESSAPQKPTEA